MHIYDMLKLRSASTDVTSGRALITNIQRTIQVMEATDIVLTYAHFKDEINGLISVRERLSNELDEVGASFLGEFGSLPPEFYLHTKEAMRIASETPKVMLSDVREIADRLSFVLLPFGYLDVMSYTDEGRETVTAIRGFVNKLLSQFNIYALAPLVYYDLSQHVRDEGNKDVYAGYGIAQAFSAIALALPMFRTVGKEINAGRADAARVRQQMEETIRWLAQLEHRVELEIAKDSRIGEGAKGKLLAHEVMIFAVPKRLNITTDDGYIIPGPCWGPDFQDVVMEVLGVKAVAGQRAPLTEMMARWGNIR